MTTNPINLGHLASQCTHLARYLRLMGFKGGPLWEEATEGTITWVVRREFERSSLRQ